MVGHPLTTAVPLWLRRFGTSSLVLPSLHATAEREWTVRRAWRGDPDPRRPGVRGRPAGQVRRPPRRAPGRAAYPARGDRPDRSARLPDRDGGRPVGWLAG